MAQRRVAGLDPQFTMDEAGNLYESGTLVANNGAWDMDEGNNLTVNGQGYGANARADALREQGYLPVESIGRLAPSQFNWPALVQQLGLTPVTGPSGEQMLSAADRTKVNEWGTQQGILKDQGGFGDFAIEAIKHVGPVMLGAPALLGPAGATSLLGEIAGNLFGNGVGALGDAATGIDSLADFNGLVPGNYTDLGGILGSGGEIASAVGGGLAPVSDGASLLDPLAEANGLQVGNYTDLGGTLQPGAGAASGAVGDPFIDAYTPPNPNVPQGTWGAPATGTGAAASLLNSLFKTNLTDADTGLIGKLLATGLGGIGASQQASASSDLAKQFMDLGKPYRDSLASLEANPASYYQSPEVQGALQQGSDSLARSLSAKVGNPILNPTALQEMQNYTTNGLLGQLNQRRSFLAGAGGLGVGQAAQLGSNATQASGGVYNALGAGLGTVFGNQKDYASELLDILKNRGGSSGMSLV